MGKAGGWAGLGLGFGFGLRIGAGEEGRAQQASSNLGSKQASPPSSSLPFPDEWVQTADGVNKPLLVSHKML